jgi:hypothetical protein
MTEHPSDEDDDWPAPIHTPEERKRADKAYEATFDLRRKALRYGYLVLGVLVILVIVLLVTH